ncbi:MAG: DegT/DnrJ/EryC1/StrS family aminotransferase [Phycisphaerae bacterium]|nr:DegT/DnrJ/EryC1/StrS family aminotransferase [Phycisphaerae bacterium]
MSTPKDLEPLAIDGGRPVRIESLPIGPHGIADVAEEEIAAVTKVLRRRKIFRYLDRTEEEGLSEAAQLEKAFCEFTGCRYGIGTTGGTTALIAGLVGIGVGVGDEVIIPGYTYIATPSACLVVGAIPVIAEIDESLTIDPQDIRRKITPQTKAIIPVDMIGLPCKMDEIMAVAREHDLLVLEDVAQACGGGYKGRALGSIGNAGCFSLQHYKLVTSGEGGMIVTNDQQTYYRAACRHDSAMCFWDTRMDFKPFAGENFRMCDLRGALGLVQFGRLQGILAQTRKVKQRILAQIRDLPIVRPCPINDEPGDCGISIVLTTGSAERSLEVSQALNAEGIANGTKHNAGFPDRHIYCYWDYVMDKHSHDPSGWPWTSPLYEGSVEYARDMCPRTLDILDRAISIGITQRFTESDADDVARAIRKVALGLNAKAS